MDGEITSCLMGGPHHRLANYELFKGEPHHAPSNVTSWQVNVCTYLAGKPFRSIKLHLTSPHTGDQQYRKKLDLGFCMMCHKEAVPTTVAATLSSILHKHITRLKHETNTGSLFYFTITCHFCPPLWWHTCG
jgi:hypothetical protein